MNHFPTLVQKLVVFFLYTVSSSQEICENLFRKRGRIRFGITEI